MLHATVQKLGDVSILRLEGRIVVEDASSILLNAALSQMHARMLVLDLAQVDTIDAGSLGVMLGLRNWARSNAINLRLMNVMNRVEQVFELTKLDHVFEFCSVKDLFCLLHRAAAVGASSVNRSNSALATCSQLLPDAAEQRPLWSAYATPAAPPELVPQ